MTHNRATIVEAESVGDDDHLAHVLNVAIKTTENVVALERQHRESQTHAEELDFSPYDLIDGEPITLTELEHTPVAYCRTSPTPFNPRMTI